MAKKQKPVSSGREKFYVTNAIPYVNASPHIGFALEAVQSDVLARWHRLIGDDTFFLLGADENGQKVYTTAKEQNKTVEKLIGEITPQFERLCRELNLSTDNFIRTADPKRHWPGAQKMWQALDKAGYIYKAAYRGLYCVGCELYYTEKELVDGLCPIHKTKPEVLEEENYFFKLSAFQNRLIKLIESDELRIIPETRKHEILSFIKSGLEDISFSRLAEKLPTGVPVPGDESQRMYVWCDALVNYLTGIGYGLNDDWKHWWPADVQVIGKDILRFHAAFWPAMLLAAKLPLPTKLYVHGFITVEGHKMSKSLGNVIDPFQLIEEHSVDPIRYYLLAILPLGSDGDYSHQHFAEVYDSHLANDFGNLVSRVLAMIGKDLESKVPQGTADAKLKEHVGQTYHELRELLDGCSFAQAIELVHKLVITANQFIDKQQPYKQAGQAKADTLYTLAQILGHLSLLYQPFMPSAAGELQSRLSIKHQNWDWDSLRSWEKVPAGTKVIKGEALFPKSQS